MLYLFNNDSHDTQPSTICTQEMGQQNQILTSVNIHVDFYDHVKNSKNGGPLRVFYGIYTYIDAYVYVYIYINVYVYVYVCVYIYKYTYIYI